MAGDSINVKIGADASGMRSGAREASAHVDGLLAHIKEFKSEAVSSGRQARFFASELAEIIPGADGAKEALRNLIVAGLGMGGIESMIAATKLLVGVFHELTEEEHKAHETFTKFLEDQKKSVDALNVSVEKMLMTMRGATRAEIMGFEQTHELLEQKKTKTGELTEAQHKLTDAQKAAAAADVEGSIGGAALVSVWEKQVATIRGEIKALDELIGKKNTALKPLAGADAAAAKLQTDVNKSIEEAKRNADQETTDNVIRLLGIETKQQIDQASDVATFKEALAKEIADAQRRADDATTASEINKLRIYTEQDRAQKQAAFTAQALAEKTRDLMQAARPFEHAFKNAFASIIEGSKTAGQAFEDLGKGLLVGVVDQLLKMATEAIVQMIAGMLVAKTAAVSTTQGYIAEAVAGAAASQAFIPIIGPGLAAGAAGSMLALLEGMTGPLLSAAVGMPRVPGDMPVFVHKDESILTVPQAEAWRSGGGGDYHLHLHGLLIDGQSVQRFFSSTEARRAMREEKRNGHL